MKQAASGVLPARGSNHHISTKESQMAASNSTRLTGNVKDERGNVYGKLTVIEFAKVDRVVYWLCRCECGAMTTVAGTQLRRGHTRTCSRRCGHTRHDMARTPEYRAWQAMKDRCYNSHNARFSDYGGRGITVCDHWRNSFAHFLADMGPRPSPKHSLERIDNDLGYCPENCEWATPREQANNRRTCRYITHDGRTQCVTAWARELGIRQNTFDARVKKWGSERAISTPVRKR
mgnify:CR=1